MSQARREDQGPAASGIEGFRAGGEASYLDVLRDEEDRKLFPLQEALKTVTDDAGRKALNDQVESIRREYKRKRWAARYANFGHR
jgi:hypothetical protein